MPLTPDKLARQLERDARALLRSHHLSPAVRCDRKRDAGGREHWVVADPAAIEIPPGRMGSLPGRWTIRMSWEVYGDPAGGDARVMMSSVSLNAHDVPRLSGAEPCLIRYDTNHFPDAPAAGHSPVHVNVLQPGQLKSSVHYPMFGLDHDHWPLDAVLAFFLSQDLVRDLAPLAG